jgi:hypothetical protein
MNTASSGHILMEKGNIIDATFGWNLDDTKTLQTLTSTIQSFRFLINPEFTGEISLMEFLALINDAYDISTPLFHDIVECLKKVHRHSITIH